MPWLENDFDNVDENSALTLELVNLPNYQTGKQGCFAAVIRNVLTPDECACFVDCKEK